jgi:hypothetical protein
MSDVDPDGPFRGGRVLTGLFWSGVGLVPLAGLLLLVSSGGAIRLAAFLAVLAVVLIGLSITLRPDPSALRTGMEETLLEEIDMLREDVRDDITTAARATHQALDERVQILQQTVDALRAELEALRATGHVGTGHVGAGHVGAGHVTGPPAGPAYPPGGHQPVIGAAAVPAPPAPPATAHGGETHPSGQSDRRPGAAGRAHVPTGVVRHTETVHHVTTRSTFVDRHGEDGGYHAPPAEPASSPPAWAAPAQPPLPAAAPEEGEESWTDRMLRERYGTEPRRFGPGDGPGERRDGGRRRRRDDDDEPDAGPAAGQRRAGDQDQWASVHGDDRAAELRMGERRAAMRSNHAGSEVRIEDRWAAVRREWDRPGPDTGGREREGSTPQRWEWDGPRPDTGPHGRDRREPRALPPANDLPSWNADWEEPARDREPRSRRHRDDDAGYPPDRRAGYPSDRRFDFELSDERWR